MSEKKPEPGILVRWMEKLGITDKNAALIKWAAVVVAIGILFMQAGDLFGLSTRSSGSSDGPPDASLVTTPSDGEEDELTRLERRYAADLEEKLSLIRGAGTVEVLVTLASGPTIDVVKNRTVDASVTTEKAADESTRETESTNTREDHVFYRDGSAERPVVSRTTRPEIAGVLIVADGAQSALIRAQLLDAARIALNIPANRIQVVAANRGE